MTNKEESVSDKLRKQGNEIYAKVNSNMAAVLHENRLLAAILFYRQAAASSCTRKEKMSALKNIGSASNKLAKCVDISMTKMLFYLKDSVSSFTEALDLHIASTHSHDINWVHDIEWKLYMTVTEFLKKLQEVSEEDNDTRSKELPELCLRVHKIAKSRCYLDMAKMYFGKALIFLEKKDYRKCLPLFGDCYYPIEEAMKFVNVAFKDEVNVSLEVLEDLMSQIHVTEEAARALQAIDNGDKLQEKIIFENEFFATNFVFDCIDWYQQAIVYSVIYSDLESEAIASTKIGILYIRVLKMFDKGYSRLKHAFDLAESMKPRNFNETSWYKQCLAEMKYYQEEKRRQEEEAWAKSRGPHLEKLHNQLTVIQNLCKESPYKLLEHIYANHPPKNKAVLCSPITPDKLKKALRDALVHYHPDKNSADKYGMEWFVLSEEICKYISVHYECQKGVD